jgi:hypothetical protein
MLIEFEIEWVRAGDFEMKHEVFRALATTIVSGSKARLSYNRNSLSFNIRILIEATGTNGLIVRKNVCVFLSNLGF